MSKRKFARFGAIAGTLVAAMALISTLVVGTGAYFTDSKPGAITGNLGTVAVDISGQNINFANLMPGETQTQTVWVRNTGTGNEDIYLAFDNGNGAWSAVNDLGQYGKFTVNGNVYDNLNNAWNSTTGVAGTPSVTDFMSNNTSSGCYHVGRVPVNYLPHVIKLGTLTPGQLWSFDVSFQFNPCMTVGAGETLWGTPPSPRGDFNPVIPAAPLNFAVAAFQPGVDPNNQMNGAGKIAPLPLPYAGDLRNSPNVGGAIYQ